MKALVKRRAEIGLWMEDVPEPVVGECDVLIKIDKTGICGTDVHIFEWDAWAQRTIPVPLVVGHEFVGEIVSVGSHVTDFYPGEIVSGEGFPKCGRAPNGRSASSMCTSAALTAGSFLIQVKWRATQPDSVSSTPAPPPPPRGSTHAR